MISYLKGTVVFKREKFIVLDIHGVGYKVFVSQKTLSKIPESASELKLFCFLNVRETALDLYGFLDREALDFFETVNAISGIGPKLAMEISSLGSLENIKEKILAHDEKVFEGIPGIGHKKAQAIILGLSGKIKDIAKKKVGGDEAEDALINLGFSRQEVKRALTDISKTIHGSEQRIKEALKLLGQ